MRRSTLSIRRFDTVGATNLREQTLGRISAELDTFGKIWTHRVFADYFEDDFISRDPTFGLFENFGERGRYGYLSTLKFETPALFLARHTFTTLVERQRETFEQTFETGTAERSQSGYALEYKGDFARQAFVSANIRHDDKDAFDDATTYRIAGAYVIRSSGTRLHASYGKGITDPTFFELFGRTSDFVGNPDLKPEESIGWDAGIEQKFLDDRITADITYFEADLTDEIAGFGNSVRNETGTSERRGVEFTVSAQLTSDLLLNGTYTYTDATDPDGSEEVRRPPHAASLSLAYTFLGERARINADAVYNGERKDDDFSDFLNPSRVTLDEYLLVNLAGSYKLDDNFELFGRVENLLDEDYEEVFGYSTAPVTAYAGVKLTLGDAPAPLEPALK